MHCNYETKTVEVFLILPKQYTHTAITSFQTGALCHVETDGHAIGSEGDRSAGQHVGGTYGQVVPLSAEGSVSDVLDRILHRDGRQHGRVDDDARAVDTAPDAPTGELIHQQFAAGLLDTVVSFQKRSTSS